jgi:UPF0042 nucleotide-binding protein
MKTRARTKRRTAGGSRSRILIITGLSGSGKTVALRAVEDAGFSCVDNIPASLIQSLIEKISGRTRTRNIAIGIDIREKEFLGDFEMVLKGLRASFTVEILFLEADTGVIIRRFKETRRPHPLGGDIAGAIGKERDILSVLKQNADRVIDTSPLSPHDLRRLITSLYTEKSSYRDLGITFVSFGFKYGIPQNIDLLFDVRFLPNPHFIPALTALPGTDRRVSGYIFRHAVTKEFMKRITHLLRFLISQYIREGKSYLAIAFGCTGGRHRSPAIVEKIARSLKREHITLNIIHRDLS